MAPDRHQLMLDNSDMYVVSPAVDISSVAVADRVRINWDKEERGRRDHQLVKAPLTGTATG